MMNFGYPNALGVLGAIVSALFFVVCLAVVVGLGFLLVRFLLVATRAAQLYVAKNQPVRPVAPAATTPITPAVPPATSTATNPAANAPTKPRTPKTPPTP